MTPKVCTEPGCPNLRPCDTHRKIPWAGSNRRKRLPSDWDTRRAKVMRRDGRRCQHCGAPATDVDHIVNNDNHELTNLQALCATCHRAKTQHEATRARTTPNTPPPYS